VTHVEVIGKLLSYYAIAVHFTHLGESWWFAPELLEFVDHGVGKIVTIGTQKLVRRPDGSWLEEKTGRTFKSAPEAYLDYQGRKKPSRPWWKFW
jgi:hypothetical protein